MMLENSIKSIVLVITVFILSFFMAFVSGFSIANLKTPFGNIKYLYLKIYPKIELNIKEANLNFPSSNSSTNVDLKLINEIIQLIPKFISKIEIQNSKIDSFEIKRFVYNNGIIDLSSSKIDFLGTLKKDKLNLNIPKYNIKTFITFKKPLQTTIFYKNQKADLKIDFDKNIAIINGKATITNLKENNITIKYANPKINLLFNIDTLQYKGNIKTSYIGILYKNYLIDLYKNNLFVGKYYKLTSKNINVISNDTLLFATNNTISFDKFVFANIGSLKGHFKKYDLNINDLILTYKNSKNIFLKSKYSEIYLYNIDNKLKSIRYIKYNNFEKVILSTIHSKSKKYKFNLYSQQIKGDFKTLFSNLINGTYSTIKVSFFKVKEDIPKDTVSAKIALLDNIKVKNLNIKYLPILEVNFSTNAKFDKSFFNTISKVYKIDIPFNQLKGKNKTKAYISYDYNNTLTYKIKSNISNFEANISNLFLNAKQINILATDKKSIVKIKHASLKDLNLSFDSNIIYKNNLIKTANVLNYSYYPFISLENFKLHATYDINKSLITLKELNSTIDLNKNTILLPSIKPILKYTPFRKILNDSFIKYNFKTQILDTKIYPKYPVFLDKKTHKHKLMDLKIHFSPYLKITSPFAEIKQKKDTFIYLYNMDINLSAAMKNYEELNETISKINKNSTDSNSKTIIKAAKVDYIYDDIKILSDTLEIVIDKEINITSKYKKSLFKGWTQNNYFLMEGNNFSKEELTPSFPFLNDAFKKLNLNFYVVKAPDDFLTGNIKINNLITDKLKLFNNIIAFLNTIPAILSLQKAGYSSKGYQAQGNVLFLFYQNIFYIKKLNIQGNNLGFIGKGYIDTNKKTIHLKLSVLIKMKVKDIPLIGKGLSYILFGKDNSITVKIEVTGPIADPVVSQDLGTSILLLPFKIIKRIITLPFYLAQDEEGN